MAHSLSNMSLPMHLQTAVGQSLIHRYGLATAGIGVGGLEGNLTTVQVPKSVLYARWENTFPNNSCVLH